MALLGTHTLNDIPIQVYASASDIDYSPIKYAIMLAIDGVLTLKRFKCDGFSCDAACPFYDNALPCLSIATDFLREHYLSQYPEYFI